MALADVLLFQMGFPVARFTTAHYKDISPEISICCEKNHFTIKIILQQRCRCTMEHAANYGKMRTIATVLQRTKLNQVGAKTNRRGSARHGKPNMYIYIYLSALLVFGIRVHWKGTQAHWSTTYRIRVQRHLGAFRISIALGLGARKCKGTQPKNLCPP